MTKSLHQTPMHQLTLEAPQHTDHTWSQRPGTTPEDFIPMGDISGWIGGVAIPGPSRDEGVAAWRHNSGDIEVEYSEPPVDIGELQNQQRLLELFADKDYGQRCIFTINTGTGEVTSSDIDNERLQGINQFSPEERDLIVELMWPNIDQVIKDYQRFWVAPPAPLSFVTELAEREDIEFDESRPKDSAGNQPVTVQIEMQGGPYIRTDFSGKAAHERLLYHKDSFITDSGDRYTHYVGTISDAVEPLGTVFAPGVYATNATGISGQHPILNNNGPEQFGIEPIKTEQGRLYRAGDLDNTRHSSPLQPMEPVTRIFTRMTLW